MPAIKMIEEADATGRVEDIYREIKDDLVPNMYTLMAPNPPYLDRYRTIAN